MKGTKILKIVLDGFGSYLGMEKGCYIVRDREGNFQRYPQFEQEIGEVVLKSGNFVSVGALASLAFWEIDCLILTRKGRPVAVLKNLEDDSHVRTRICQYEALKNGKGVEIAKQIVLAKIKGQNQTLEKHGLKPRRSLTFVEGRINGIGSEDLRYVRRRLLGIEGSTYFKQIFRLFRMRPQYRKTFKAYDGMNNIFNLVYTLLEWKVYRAVLKAKLEPYLGFLHSEQFGKPSLVCDLMELYRYLADDFLIQYCGKLKLSKKDFVMKRESFSKRRKGQREYLNDSLTKDLMRDFYAYLEGRVEVPRIRHGSKQTLETLINEEALLLAKYLRNERKTWIPRITGTVLSEL
ncbi:MAG: hypothetical protein AVW06_04570 [Hadesarchaea archaeon DG-33-1]|nr:MAG: hypothetical protein AVW06_04570 [Hadesarchaea archaeon DG-33-1]